MVSVGLEIVWSPVHYDKFIAWGPELFLYEIGPILEQPFKGSQSCFKTSENTQAVLLATNSSHRYVKCLDVYPKPDSDVLLAVGQANGKVSITSFGVIASEAVGREFSPTSARQCNSVIWNHAEPNILAAALDKSKADHAVLVWDAFRYNLSDRPLMEYGLGEGANSLTWLNASTLIAGMGSKSIKLIDRRDPRSLATGSQSTITKAVYGICVDQHSPDLLASFFDSQICVWDLRNFEKPITTTTRQKNVTKILWCPTRHNLLASLQRDSAEIVLHDLQLTTVGNEEVEPTLLERPIQPCPSHKLTSFSWHPAVESRLLTISLSWNITDYFVLERITLNWFPSSNLVWTHGHRMMKVVSDVDSIYSYFPDISVTIKKRALADYGLKPELWQNGELAENESLKNLWYWLYTSRNLVEEGIVKAATYHPGVVGILAGSSDRRSEALNVSWTDVANPSFVKMYRSEERDAALQLCGWRYEKDLTSLTNFLERLQVEGAFSRAAAIAVFNLKISLAISILNRGASRKQQTELGIVAMALSGFSGEMWKTHCAQAAGKLADPYIRATFAFLTAEPERYDAVLNETKIAVEDRVAFACTFLSDVKLGDYLTKLADRLTEDGNLAGILLTGTTPDGVKLLQRYLDLTGDVQSVSLLAVRAFSCENQLDSSMQNWIESYQLLLDSTRLWNQRAHFDIALNTSTEGKKVAQQIFISCNFCQKSISSFIQGLSRSRTAVQRPANIKTKMSSCPNCRKPLPRCAICLVHIGTPSRLIGNKTADLASWFTWCQTCRHGGHTDHIQNWFAAHSECPVTGCTCRCLSLDGTPH